MRLPLLRALDSAYLGEDTNTARARRLALSALQESSAVPLSGNSAHTRLRPLESTVPMQKTLTLTNAQAGKVIGVRGAVVRTIRQESGATIDIDHNGGDSRAIHLSGEPSQVEAAEKLIW